MKINHNIVYNCLKIKIKETIVFDNLGLSNAEHPNSLSFIDNRKYIPQALANKNIKGLFLNENLQISSINSQRPDIYCIEVEDARYSFYSLQNYISSKSLLKNQFPTQIGQNPSIHKTAYVSDYNVKIGDNVIIEPNVSILRDVEIGDSVTIRAGSVIGAEGFEHKRTSKGIVSVLHDGKVIIGNRVVIGALNGISKGFSYRHTRIGDETKTDNLVHIAHCVQIGKRCFLPASCMIAGSTTLGDDVWIGPHATVSSQINIGNNAYITLGAVVTRNVQENQKVTGNFALPHETFINNLRKLKKGI